MAQDSALDMGFEDDEGRGLRLCLTLLIAAPLLLLVWAAFATLDEVAVGPGKVVPSSRSQLIQSPDGGVLRDLRVAEGDRVEADQVLALLDPAIAQASVGEADAKVQALSARAARLEAELAQADKITFPDGVDPASASAAKEISLFHTRQSAHKTARHDVQQALDLAEDEVRLIEPLLATGAASQLEFLRAQQKVTDLKSRLNQIEDDYTVEARNDLAQTIGELEPLLSIQAGRSSQLARTEIRSPVRGVVKEIAVATIGGVVAPGGKLFEVVPIDDRLLIEARISPRDIAFIHPGQPAAIKITAYDSANLRHARRQCRTDRPRHGRGRGRARQFLLPRAFAHPVRRPDHEERRRPPDHPRHESPRPRFAPASGPCWTIWSNR